MLYCNFIDNDYYYLLGKTWRKLKFNENDYIGLYKNQKKKKKSKYRVGVIFGIAR